MKKIVDTPKSYSKQTFSNTGVVFNEYDSEYGTILNRRQMYSKQAFSNTGVVLINTIFGYCNPQTSKIVFIPEIERGDSDRFP